MLYEQVKLKLRDKDPRRLFSLSPSSLSSCRRRVWFLMHRPEDLSSESDSERELLLREGKLQEEAMVDLLRWGGYEIPETTRNLSVSIELPNCKIHSKIDGLISGQNLKRVFILEIKTFTTELFRNFRDGEIPESYLDQATLYSYALNLPTIIFAKCRETGDIFDIAVPFDSGRFEDIVDTMNYFDDLERMVTPPQCSGKYANCDCPDYIPKERKVLQMEDLTEDKKLLAMEKALRYAELSAKLHPLNSELDSLREWFRSFLESYQAFSVTVPATVGLTVRFRISEASLKSIDDLLLSRDFPEAYTATLRRKSSGRLTFEVRWRGEKIS